MQSETTDFAHSAATRRTERNIMSCLTLAHLLPDCENITSFTNRKYITHCTVAGGGLSHSQVTRTENLMKFERVVFQICDRTYRHTDTLIEILRPATEAEVISR